MTASTYENVYPRQYQDCFLFSKCCFCIPLKTGCFILGYISLILNFIVTLFFIGTLALLAVYTHGFHYIYLKQNEDGKKVPDENPIDKNKINMTMIIVVLVGGLNVGWFLMNIVLLVGLHRKRPGHIKLHVSVATIRLLMTIIGVAMYGAHTINSLVICCSEIALSSYFILLYYIYALQLKREQELEIAADNVFSYPQKMDKVTLTETK